MAPLYGRHVIGSSPRVRGTVSVEKSVSQPRRFIPARAGNGKWPRSTGDMSSVHPRACGERFGWTTGKKSPFGSSPRVRGTDGGACVPGLPVRFIPARAGNGRCWRGRRSGRSVHPRACGERKCRVMQQLSHGGSSPRVRGTVDRSSSSLLDSRFIPARAGNGYPLCNRCAVSKVHPRACGERTLNRTPAFCHCGSSPRVRGTDRHASRGACVERFIPARAGNGLYLQQ